ncbi:MAG: TldD/PmbA family protein, partial [bacterium]|nr:TldD/PmbA family protein [bacterium]
IITSEPVDFSGSRTGIHLFSSAGLSKSYSKSYYSFIYEAVAEKDGLKETDYWYEDGHHFSDLPDARGIADIGRIAAERAIKRLGGDNIPSGEYPVVFTSRTAGSLLQLIYYAVCGEEVLVRNSFMVDKLGKEIFPSYITIMDDPVMPRHIGSYPFDGEGMAGISKAVVEKGVLSTYLHNSYSAAKLGMELTGNASRGIASLPGIASGNFYLESGKGSMDDLVLEMQNGLIVEDIFTSGMNDVTGDFSYGCSGFLVEKGKIVAPVKEITIAGNVLDLFKNIIAIADDNQYKDAVSSPSFLVSKLAVAGAQRCASGGPWRALRKGRRRQH